VETIIGLGNAGCQIADKFAAYPQYTTYKINSEKSKESNYLYITPRDSHEEYEAKTRLKKSFFEDIQGPVLFVVGGSGTISGATLRVLERLKHLDIHVLYVKPDVSLLSEKQEMQHRVVFGVLQEYARCDLLKRMFVVDNANMATIIGDVPMMEYYDRINTMIATSVHMINVCMNSSPVLSTFTDIAESARISTIGLLDPESGEEAAFYDLEFPRHKLYFYAINRERLETDGALFKRITGQIKDKNDENLKATFGVYPTDYEEDYAYCIHHATFVQEQKVDF
tara:strand:- start:65 stop:910 length:846 start_codon:yes stop_codon:yes gene_type:complete